MDKNLHEVLPEYLKYYDNWQLKEIVRICQEEINKREDADYSEYLKNAEQLFVNICQEKFGFGEDGK